jgi:hypothetical protein
MSKLYLFFKTIILDAILVFLLGPAHFIYLAFRYGTELGHLLLAFLPVLFVTTVLLYLINIVYTILKLIYDDLNAFDKTRWFGVWLVIHTLFYLYWELTKGGMSTGYYVECVISAAVYLGFLIYLQHRMYTKLQISQS